MMAYLRGLALAIAILTVLIIAGYYLYQVPFFKHWLGGLVGYLRRPIMSASIWELIVAIGLGTLAGRLLTWS